jgi:hypothetical protein
MQTSDIRVGLRYTGARWSGDRLVTEIQRNAQDEPLVRYVDQRTQHKGHAVLSKFAMGATQSVPLFAPNPDTSEAQSAQDPTP